MLGTALAVLSAVVPYSLELAALRRLPVRTVSVLTSLEPASAGLVGVLVLGEELGLVRWVAPACVGAASAGAVGPRSPRRGGCSGRPPGEPGSGQHAVAQLGQGAGEKARDMHL
ncbi:EamA family transporter [Streptomyces sp. NPDC046925]|uniref:EamA family transporter n=1 Tax=Streptomyces sp. NPDC046925 TaxID=3155375 RepID=UPI0033FA4DAE